MQDKNKVGSDNEAVSNDDDHKEEHELTGKQKQLQSMIRKHLKWAMKANHGNSEAEQEEAKDAAWKQGQPLICEGRPGTGKTTVVLDTARAAAAEGASVLLTVVTARHVTRMRQMVHGQDGITVDTCHAAFKLFQPRIESLPTMQAYDLVVVDEFSLLDGPQFELLLAIWHAAERIPVLLFLGDRHQLPGMGSIRPWHLPVFAKQCKRIELRKMWRCKDTLHAKILEQLRIAMPKKSLLRTICRGRKAWSGYEPTLTELKDLLAKHPDTTILTCTKKKERWINELAVQALFGNRKPIVTIKGDIEQNPENYDDTGKLREDRRPKPAQIPIFKGMKLCITQNVRKQDGYVNGMCCEVEQFDENGNGGVLRVKLENGERLPITMWTDMHKTNVRYFPVRMGYGSTIHKAQGGEYKHVTVWLDVRFMPAAAYTALSRVARMEDLLLGGELAKEHFVPANYTHPGVSVAWYQLFKETKAKLPGQAGKKSNHCGIISYPGRRE